jgi:hypothetical protein
MRQAFFVFYIAGILLTFRASAQQKDTAQVKQLPDSVLEKKDNIYTDKKFSQAARDSIEKKRKSSYRRATIYSAILPGAGQVYNKKYWKLPIVYAAVGIPAYLFFWNKSWYQKSQYALTVTVNGSKGDSLAKVDPQLMPFVLSGDENGIITNRDTFRKNQDYAVIFFLLFYGLNIVDATVDAHLKDFNVSSDLSFRVKPMIVPGPTPSAGITLAFDVHKPRSRALSLN